MAYYNYDRICSYNGLYNFILSGRGNGKSYGAKKKVIQEFLKSDGKNQFVYVRRYKTELKKRHLFFDDIRHEFPNVDLEVKGNCAYIDGKVGGYFIALSTSAIEKSNSYPNVTNIIFDEFIIDKSYIRYLPNEVENFLDLYETIARARNGKEKVKAFFLANKVSLVNPYFLFFNCIPKNEKRFNKYKNGLIVIEQFTDAEFIEMKKATDFGQLVDGTNWGSYAIDNTSLRDNNTFILETPPRDIKFLFSIIFRGKEVGIWISYKESIFYCNSNIQTNSKNRYAITKDDHDINLMMYNTLSTLPFFNELVRYYRVGYVRFKDMEIKNFIYEVMKFMNIK